MRGLALRTPRAAPRTLGARSLQALLARSRQTLRARSLRALRARSLQALCAVALAVASPSARASDASAGAAAPKPGAFVLGIDGMDPVIVQRLMDEGKLPEFKRLAEEGCFQSLGTVNPPQSPVAWSSFATGMDPGGHGIFDFVHRDPATYRPLASATPPPSGETPSSVKLFGYVLPLGGETVANNRSGKPFWDYLQEAGIPTQVYRIPGNYPVPESGAFTLSGMGTVDMRGEFGKYTWYTDDAFTKPKEGKADLELVTVEDEDLDGRPDTVHTKLRGPPDIFHLEPGRLPGRNDFLVADLTVHVDPDEDALWIRVGGSDALVREGEWSEWLSVGFDALPMGMLNLQGIVRFYAKEVRPGFRLYASPVNIDPAAPAQPIATPDGAAEALAAELGPYWTQGFPEEINALKDGLFDDDDYEKQVALVHGEGERMLEAALRRFAPGRCTFMYLSDIDLQCHMLWRHGDPKTQGAPHHPAWREASAAKHAHDIENHYRDCDRMLGRVRASLPEGTLLMVMSDHGFQPYTRQAHVNAWLRDHGYLFLKDGKATGSVSPPDRVVERTLEDGAVVKEVVHGQPDFDAGDVDWSRTSVYGLGFNGLYLNLKGREARGSVDPADADALVAKLRAELLAWRDDKDGAAPVLRVDRSQDIYAAARRAEAPDLIVGYNAGYDCSDDSTLGRVGAAVLTDNDDPWSGSHLMAPEVVPGILLVNRKLPGAGHALPDLTVTLLQHFGLPAGEGMVGRSILEP
jgi:predicted AlkP superfamily phosphohydrolase/phosphomutase